MNKKNPTIGSFIDDEEKALIKAIEGGKYEGGTSLLTPERKAELQASARATMNAERTKITLRLSKPDLSKLKALAMQEGMPYQTLIGSILHKAVSE